MTIDEAKKLLPPELKYPLPIEVIDNLLGIQRIAIDMADKEDKGMHYAMMAALIELKERRESEQCVCDKLQTELLDTSKGYLDYKAGYDDGIKKAIDILNKERGEDGI
jgi:hypothetical protein